MAGIISYGAYVPWHRMGKATRGWSSPNERAVANFDEDSITMAVAAALNCLGDHSHPAIDAAYFASTTPPYKGKSNASVVAAATDLPESIFCMDFANSPRAGTNALKAALDAVGGSSNKRVLVAAADLRIPQPRSQFETAFGDGAAALLLGDSDVVAEVEDCCSVSQEMLDTWREDGDKYLRTWEDRFVAEEGYMKLLPRAVSALLAKNKLQPKDFARAVLYGPDVRRHREMIKTLGFDPKSQVQDPLLSTIGNTGAAAVLMTLAAALDESKPGDRILLANYGDGADAFLLRVTDGINTSRKARWGMSHYLSSKKLLPDYETYLTWRGLLDKAPPARRPALRSSSAAAMLRELNKNLRLHGSRCKQCGYPQYPPQVICTRCHARDNSEPYGFSDKKAKVFTYTPDNLAPTLDPPVVVAVVDFEGGGRMFSIMTDREPGEVAVGMPVEMTFRNMYVSEGIRNYFWKSKPVR